MQPPPGNGRRRNNARPMNDGFPAFPAFPPFPDPFAEFGGGPGFFSDMFEMDPFFRDPFTRPFGAPFGSGGLFGQSGIFNSGLFGIGPGQANSSDWVRYTNGTRQGQGNLLGERPFNSPSEGNRRNIHMEEGSRRGVQIEELSEDHDVPGSGQPNSNQEPIIEHPEDDDDRTDRFRYQPRTNHLSTTRRQSRGSTHPVNNPVRSYSFHSSSVVYGGSNGASYSSQTTRRQGPDGVIEEEHQEKDTGSGRETHRVSHGVGEKGHSLTRKRNAEGREENLEILHNLEQDEVQDFERTWETLADKSLPKWNRSSAQRLGSSGKALPALPSSGSSRSYGR